MENETFGQRVKRTSRKVMRVILIVILIVGAAIFSFEYWGVNETGLMAGKVLRITERGVIFKTFEGKLNLETFGALKDVSPIAESFDFSIEKSQQEVIKDLQAVALTGERINLHFIKRYGKFPWRGDSRYFAVKVERLGK